MSQQNPQDGQQRGGGLRIRDAIDEFRNRRGTAGASDAGAAAKKQEGTEKSRSTIQVSEPTGENTADYFSSGPAPIIVDNTDEWSPPIGFGLLARVVNLRFSDDIEVAFSEPYNNDSNAIYLQGTSSPFTIGGPVPADTAFMWVRQATSAQTDPELQIVAYE